MFEYVEMEGPEGLVGIRTTAKLTHEDYQKFLPKFDEAIAKHGSVRVYFDMTDFHGMELQAVWDDLKWETKHCKEIERCAVVGDKKWEEWMIKICKPFYKAAVRYFDAGEKDQALEWIKEGA